MANNNAIQILRAPNGVNSSNKGINLLDGQPFYNAAKNYLTIGDGNSTIQAEPITVRKLIGYFDDNDGITGNKDYQYSIEPDGHDLKVKNFSGNINIDAFNGVNINNGVTIIDRSGVTIGGEVNINDVVTIDGEGEVNISSGLSAESITTSAINSETDIAISSPIISVGDIQIKNDHTITGLNSLAVTETISAESLEASSSLHIGSSESQCINFKIKEKNDAGNYYFNEISSKGISQGDENYDKFFIRRYNEDNIVTGTLAFMLEKYNNSSNIKTNDGIDLTGIELGSMSMQSQYIYLYGRAELDVPTPSVRLMLDGPAGRFTFVESADDNEKKRVYGFDNSSGAANVSIIATREWVEANFSNGGSGGTDTDTNDIYVTEGELTANNELLLKRNNAEDITIDVSSLKSSTGNTNDIYVSGGTKNADNTGFQLTRVNSTPVTVTMPHTAIYSDNNYDNSNLIKNVAMYVDADNILHINFKKVVGGVIIGSGNSSGNIANIISDGGVSDYYSIQWEQTEKGKQLTVVTDIGNIGRKRALLAPKDFEEGETFEFGGVASDIDPIVIDLSYINNVNGSLVITGNGFSQLESLECLFLPENFSIAEGTENIFEGCTNLRIIHINGEFYNEDGTAKISLDFFEGIKVTIINEDNKYWVIENKQDITENENHNPELDNYNIENNSITGFSDSYAYDYKYIEIPYSTISGEVVVSIGEDAFSTENLKVLFIPPNIESIGGGAFANCTNLEAIYLPNEAKIYNSDGTDADDTPGTFYNCPSVQNINYYNGDADAFYGQFNINIPMNSFEIDESDESISKIATTSIYIDFMDGRHMHLTRAELNELSF